jgi:hypothetical protein
MANAGQIPTQVKASEHQRASDRVPAPLVIGITGHLDLRSDDLGPLSAAIKKKFLELKAEHRSTPLIVLSALAEGADRLAAEVALSSEVGARLFVPLPMEQTIYETDFHGESLTQFRTLLKRADGHLELPLVEGNTRDGIAQKGRQRDLQYESVGKYIVQKCQVLIALWDGVESDLVGGTSAVVKFQREGLPLARPISVDPPEGSPVYQIVTPHLGNPNPVGRAFDCNPLYPTSFKGDDQRAEKYFGRMFHRMDEFNGYAIAPDAVLSAKIAKSRKRLAQDLDEEKFSKETRADADRHALADAVALRFQAEKSRTERLLHGTVFFAFLFFVLFAHLSQHPVLMLVSLVLVVLAVVWRGRFRGRDGDTKFEDYRAMAEGLRVRFFWRLLCLPNSITDHYLSRQRSELDWIRNCFRGWDVLSDFDLDEPDSAEKLSASIAEVRRCWIADQQKYFRDASERDEKRLQWLEVWQYVLVGIALLVGAVIFGVVLQQSWPKLLHEGFFAEFSYKWTERFIILMDAALAGAALVHSYGNSMAYREHAKQYKRMENIFSYVSQILASVKNPETACQYMKKLGEEALRESADWVLLHRERPLDVPHP